MRPNLPGYRADHLLGAGGSGEVWLAWSGGPSPRPVAIKRLRDDAPAEALAALRLEATVLASLAHPHLVPVLDVVDDGPGVAVVMAHVAGGSLRSLLDDAGTLAVGELAALVEPIADALTWLHGRGLAHGDLKPENVLLRPDGLPVLADIGVGRLFGADDRQRGTAAYLDPGLLDGRVGGAAADLYALAVMAYEALTGRVPHRGDPDEVLALAAAGVHRPLASWPTVPGPVAAAIEAALDPDPTRRPRGPAAFAARLVATIPAEDRRPRVPSVGSTSVAGSATGHVTIALADRPALPSPPTHRSRRVGRALVRGVLVVAVIAAGLGLAVLLGSLGGP